MRGLLRCPHDLPKIESIQSPAGSRQGCSRAQAPGGEASAYPAELPKLRREVLVIDYDSGAPVAHHWVLYRTNRVDCYRVEENGVEWCGRWGVGAHSRDHPAAVSTCGSDVTVAHQVRKVRLRPYSHPGPVQDANG
jgi:hypothetical protein